MEAITYRPIGIIHSPFKEPKGTPIQPRAAHGVRGTVEVFPEYAAGLEDLEDFSHVILLYHFHLVKGAKLKVKPFMDQQEHGVFATRASSRPNPIGLSILRLERVEGNILYVCNIDIVDGTPLLDVKPYVPEFDIHPVERVGWLEKNVHKLPSARDDGRFVH
ncbi:MAG: tRNA (N6-threonylcarbamoyladenosine(37)-N6)-methyltransferase TrmO [Anaerolineae bacterium]|nr:tRNA (N6-threonylcarbamoyladenosine(37)-N6)-methyltransferase TrmO [Anaerolineae bacterium]